VNPKYAWLLSALAAAIPTAAIIGQMSQQSTGLYQQLDALKAQNRLAEEAQTATVMARVEDQKQQLAWLVTENFSVVHGGSPAEQRSLAGLLLQTFPPEQACAFVSDWADSSPTQAHWSGCCRSPSTSRCRSTPRTPG
jgi:hypothetical protein